MLRRRYANAHLVICPARVQGEDAARAVMTEIGVEKNTTVVFPVPVDFFSGLQKFLGQGDAGGSQAKAG